MPPSGIEDPCITTSASTLGVALPDTTGDTLGLGVLVGCVLSAVLALARGSRSAAALLRTREGSVAGEPGDDLGSPGCAGRDPPAERVDR